MTATLSQTKKLSVEHVWFPERKDRSEYVARRFSHILQGRILDVGCDRAYLKQLLAPHAAPSRPLDYTGIDIGGTPDITINLEQIDRLPFEDRSFDAIVCTDVLEHLDNFHHVFGELLRVTRGSAVISLPNCWAAARQPIARGRGSFKHYGLPLDRPMDRHKWFFSLTEAIAFFEGHRQRGLFKNLTLHATEKPRPAPVRALRRIRYPDELHYLNRYAHTLWAVLEV